MPVPISEAAVVESNMTAVNRPKTKQTWMNHWMKRLQTSNSQVPADGPCELGNSSTVLAECLPIRRTLCSYVTHRTTYRRRPVPGKELRRAARGPRAGWRTGQSSRQVRGRSAPRS